jgi:hypothetical protein
MFSNIARNLTLPSFFELVALLSEWTSFLPVVVPPRSRRAFVELLIGCMLNPQGRVTRAIGAICRDANWTNYHKLINWAQVHQVVQADAEELEKRRDLPLPTRVGTR